MPESKPEANEGQAEEFIACLQSLFARHDSIRHILRKIRQHKSFKGGPFSADKALALYSKPLLAHYGDSEIAKTVVQRAISSEAAWHHVQPILSGSLTATLPMIAHICACYGFLPEETAQMQALYPAYLASREAAEKSVEAEEETAQLQALSPAHLTSSDAAEKPVEAEQTTDRLSEYLQGMLTKRRYLGPKIYVVDREKIPPGTKPLSLNKLRQGFGLEKMEMQLFADKPIEDDLECVQGPLKELLVLLNASDTERKTALGIFQQMLDRSVTRLVAPPPVATSVTSVTATEEKKRSVG